MKPSRMESLEYLDESSSESGDDAGPAAGNNKGRKANNKKVVNQGEANPDGDVLGKTKMQLKIEASLADDPLTLSLVGQKLQNLSDLGKVPTLIIDLQKVDISKNYLDNIDSLNQLQRLKVIIASDNYIRAANLQLPKLQELDLRNNFIDKIPILSQMPQLKVLTLNANNITELKL